MRGYKMQQSKKDYLFKILEASGKTTFTRKELCDILNKKYPTANYGFAFSKGGYFMQTTKTDPRHLVNISRGVYRYEIISEELMAREPWERDMSDYDYKVHKLKKAIEKKYTVSENVLHGIPVDFVSVDDYSYGDIDDDILFLEVFSAHYTGNVQLHQSEVIRVRKDTMEILPEYQKLFFERNQ